MTVTKTLSRLPIAGAVVLFLSTPALADHGAAGTGADAAGPIAGVSARTAPKGKATISFELTLSKPDNRSDATLAALAGQHIHAHDQDHGEVYSLSASYGLTDDLTLSGTLPYVRRIDIREGTHSHSGGVAINGVDRRGNSTGFGDASIVAKWRFTGEHHHGWEAALVTGLKLPTGTTGQIDDLGERFETEHQPGTGSWDPIAGIAATRPLPGGSLNLSAVYQLSGTGSQDTRLGDRAQVTFGLIHRLLGPKIDYHHQHEDTDHHAPAIDGVLELQGEWEGQQQEAGIRDAFSGGKALYLSPGLRLGYEGWSFTAGGSIPLAQDIRLSHSETRFRIRFGISRAI